MPSAKLSLQEPSTLRLASVQQSCRNRKCTPEEAGELDLALEAGTERLDLLAELFIALEGEGPCGPVDAVWAPVDADRVDPKGC